LRKICKKIPHMNLSYPSLRYSYNLYTVLFLLTGGILATVDKIIKTVRKQPISE